jgi:acetyltransferase-like isoleucine patch superfamily enzyme
MMTNNKRVLYIVAKIIKKLRGSSIKNSSIHATSKIESGSNIVSTIMLKHSFCGYNCEISNCDIGSFCSIANGVIIGGGAHPIEWVSMSPAFYEGRDSIKAKFSNHKRTDIKRTTIGHDVWIGRNALVKQGVTIGTGAVIGMGSVVTKDVDPYTIVAGNPAKTIRRRFDIEVSESLLRSAWWNLSDYELIKYGYLFTNPQEFLQALDHLD